MCLEDSIWSFVSPGYRKPPEFFASGTSTVSQLLGNLRCRQAASPPPHVHVVPLLTASPSRRSPTSQPELAIGPRQYRIQCLLWMLASFLLPPYAHAPSAQETTAPPNGFSIPSQHILHRSVTSYAGERLDYCLVVSWLTRRPIHRTDAIHLYPNVQSRVFGMCPFYGPRSFASTGIIRSIKCAT